MRRFRLSVVLTLAAVTVTILPVRRSHPVATAAPDDDEEIESSINTIEVILETVGEGEAQAAKKGFACHAACITHFGPNNPRYKSPGCPQNLQKAIQKEYPRCEAKTKDAAEALFYPYCNSVCQDLSDQCLCKHHQCRPIE